MKHKVMLEDAGKGRRSESVLGSGWGWGWRERASRGGGRGNEKRKTLGESAFSVTKDVKTGSNSGRPRSRTL